MFKDTVGIIGGFGAYATLNFYEMILRDFASESERDYPHIFFDNDFTMPSRTRALLYGEEYETIVDMISESMKKMLSVGADHIILVCGTAHYFLKDVYKKVPEAEERVINIVDLVARYVKENEISDVLIVAAEGTLKKRVYENALSDLHCVSPGTEDFGSIRTFIESVKTNRITAEVLEEWNEFLAGFGCRHVILGCTELPVLVNAYFCNEHDIHGNDREYDFIDPLSLAVKELKRIIK